MMLMLNDDIDDEGYVDVVLLEDGVYSPRQESLSLITRGVAALAEARSLFLT